MPKIQLSVSKNTQDFFKQLEKEKGVKACREQANILNNYAFDNKHLITNN